MGWLEYLAGLVAGDGTFHYSKGDGSYRVTIADSDRAFLEHIRAKTYESLGYSGYIYKIPGKNAWALRYTRKALYTALLEKIPMLLLSPTLDFAAGIIDAEGSLQKPRRGSLRIVVVNTKVELLEAVRKALEPIVPELKIRPYGKPKGKEKQRYRLIIYGKENVQKVLATTPLQHPKFKPVF